MDVWGVLSLTADVAQRLWAEAMVFAAPAHTRYTIAGLCFLASFVLLIMARRPRAKSGGPVDAPAQRRAAKPSARAAKLPKRLTAEQAFSLHALRPALDAPPVRSAFEPQAPAPSAPLGSTREIMARMEAKRNSRVIAIIHRDNMENSVLGIEDLEDALTAIRRTPKDKALDIIVHSPGGGYLRVGQQIARAIKAHPAKTTVFVPYFALESATFIAFAADEIVMSPHAALSPVDPYTGIGAASSVLKGIKDKPIAKVDDETVIWADIARKTLDEARRVTCELMHDGRDHDGVCRLADELVSGKFSRGRAITASAAKEIGLKVSQQMPSEVYDLIRSCRRDQTHEASVAFLDQVRKGQAGGDAKCARPSDVYDSGLWGWGKPKAQGRSHGAAAGAKLVWLAQSGGHVPESYAERAKSLIRRIEQERGSHVVCVIHGDNMANDGFNFDDLEDVLSAIVASDPAKPLDVVLHTNGGNAFTGRQIARAIKNHRGRKTVFIPYYAMSAGSRISLAADQIVMGAQANLGPIDTQLYGLPVPSILHLVNVKPIEAISDEYLIMAEEARKIMAEGRSTACDLLQGTYSHDGSCAIADEMISGKWTHGFPITPPIAKQLGLNVSTTMPDVFYDLIRCFRHADGEDPSVLFIPR